MIKNALLFTPQVAACQAYGFVMNDRNLKIGSVFVETNEHCNARCLACDYWTKKTPKQIDKSIITDLLPWIFRFGIDHINWTGGEPTLHPDFSEMLKNAYNKNIRSLLITNGGILSDIYRDIGRYIYKVILSVDACSSEQYKSIRGVDRFDKVIEVPSVIKKYFPKTKVTLCMVIQHRNIDTISEFVDMAFRLPIDNISFVVPDVWGFIYPIDRGSSFGHTIPYKNNRINLVVPTHEQLDNFKEAIPIIQNKLKQYKPSLINHSLQHLYMYYDYFKSFLNRRPRPRSKHCLLPYQTAVFTVDGRVKPCFFINEGVSVKKEINPLRNPIIDSLREKLSCNVDYKRKFCDYCMQAGEI